MVARRGSPEDVGVDEWAACPTTGDHKGPHHIHPTAVAPTESWGGVYVDAYWGR